jgi:RNA polymerase sigma factor (sigma-70 family)
MDLRQESLLELWRKTPVFDEGRASWRTYAERVIANRLTSYMRGARARRRGHGLHESLDEIKHAPLARDEGVELRVDITKVLAKVSRFDRAVALSLIDNSPSETSQLLQVSRSTVYRSIDRLRSTFTAAGFRTAVFAR